MLPIFPPVCQDVLDTENLLNNKDFECDSKNSLVRFSVEAIKSFILVEAKTHTQLQNRFIIRFLS